MENQDREAYFCVIHILFYFAKNIYMMCPNKGLEATMESIEKGLDSGIYKIEEDDDGVMLLKFDSEFGIYCPLLFNGWDRFGFE